jgi:hypothetical protein
MAQSRRSTTLYIRAGHVPYARTAMRVNGTDTKTMDHFVQPESCCVAGMRERLDFA